MENALYSMASLLNEIHSHQLLLSHLNHLLWQHAQWHRYNHKILQRHLQVEVDLLYQTLGYLYLYQPKYQQLWGHHQKITISYLFLEVPRQLFLVHH
ncbi:Uncharacterised protein [Salmonella enterica subsp. enterica]|nr:hypothetical protein SES26_013425 [Salmonella enterica subsp. enterica serovar Saintpaul str. SARA26]VEA26969.1 Uncharacterised protein [Salmonella enterica subsp. enterica]